MSESIVNGHQKEERLPKGVVVEEVEIPVPWGHVAGRWWGPRNKQPIIALHGRQDNAGTWDNLIPLLPTTTSVLCLDLPGHGFSSQYPKGILYYPSWDNVFLLKRIIKYYNWSNVTLMGHSLGGGIIFMYAATFPDEVDKIICVDSSSPAVNEPNTAADNTGKSMEKVLYYEEMSEDKFPCYDYDDMIDIVCDAYNGSVSRENCKVMMRRGMAPAPKPKKGFYFKRDPRLKVKGIGTMGINTALTYASRIRCQVLNIRAVPGLKWERQDYYLSIIEKMKENTDVQYVEVEGTHHVQLEAPGKIAHIIENFIKK